MCLTLSLSPFVEAPSVEKDKKKKGEENKNYETLNFFLSSDSARLSPIPLRRFHDAASGEWVTTLSSHRAPRSHFALLVNPPSPSRF